MNSINTSVKFIIDSKTFALGNDVDLQKVISAERELACRELEEFSYRVAFSYRTPTIEKDDSYAGWNLDKIIVSSNGPYLKFDAVFDYLDAINEDEPWKQEVKETCCLASYEIPKSGLRKILKEFQDVIEAGQIEISTLSKKGCLQGIFQREQTREALHGALFDNIRQLLREQDFALIDEGLTGGNILEAAKANVLQTRAFAGAVAIHMFRPEVFQMSKTPSFDF